MYKWHKKKAIETNGEVQTPDFKIKYWRTRSLNLSYMAGMKIEFIAYHSDKSRSFDVDLLIGIYNTAEFCFVLKRSAGYCIIQLIFPASVVVAASWISLWLAEEMQFSDILTVMLSILFLSYSYNMVMPKVWINDKFDLTPHIDHRTKSYKFGYYLYKHFFVVCDLFYFAQFLWETYQNDGWFPIFI